MILCWNLDMWKMAIPPSLLFIHQFVPDSCDPMGWTVASGSSIHGILRARIPEWIAISFSRGSSWLRDWTCVSCIGRWSLYHWAIREALCIPHGSWNNYYLILVPVLVEMKSAIIVPFEMPSLLDSASSTTIPSCIPNVSFSVLIFQHHSLPQCLD